MALVDILSALGASGELVLAGVAHFNHQLREQAAVDDERFCRELAAALDLPIVVGTADVRARAREDKRSIEDTARRLRYEFLDAAADQLQADGIAVGHSLEDQAETFLLRLLRGAGTKGLGSIRPKAGRVIRPLIDVSRAELRQYAAERGLKYQDDETNADVTIPRNRVRLELLPYLEREFSPRIVEVLAREAALARQDDEWLERAAIELATSLVLTDTAQQTVVVDAAGLTSLHPGLASRVARHAMEPLSGGRFVGYDHVARFMELASGGTPGAALSLPGQRARYRPDGRVVLEPEPVRGVEEVVSTFRVALPVPGEVIAGPWAVGSQGFVGVRRDPSGAVGSSGSVGAVLVGGVTGQLAVRFRKPGDRFEPPGMGGRTKKLQDYLVDRKVAREERDRLPLVVDENDRIIWVVGHGVSEGFRASAPSAGVILLKARRLGGEV